MTSSGSEIRRSAEEILAIQTVVVRYGFVLDDRDWDGFRQVFTDDAVIDFGAGHASSLAGDRTGGLAPIVGRDEIVRQFRDILTHPYQHMLVNHLVEDVSTDEVVVRSKALLPIPGQLILETVYRDVVVRTSEGWRIKHKSVKGHSTDRSPWLAGEVATWIANGATFA